MKHALNVASVLGGPRVRTGYVALWILALMRSGRRADALQVAAVAAGVGAVNSLVKRIVKRPRPPKFWDMNRASGASFPSGHASGTAALSALAAVQVRSMSGETRLSAGIGICGVLFTALVCRARVAKRAHHVSDVVGGAILGYAWLVLVLALSRRLYQVAEPNE